MLLSTHTHTHTHTHKTYTGTRMSRLIGFVFAQNCQEFVSILKVGNTTECHVEAALQESESFFVSCSQAAFMKVKVSDFVQ